MHFFSWSFLTYFGRNTCSLWSLCLKSCWHVLFTVFNWAGISNKFLEKKYFFFDKCHAAEPEGEVTNNRWGEAERWIQNYILFSLFFFENLCLIPMEKADTVFNQMESISIPTDLIRVIFSIVSHHNLRQYIKWCVLFTEWRIHGFRCYLWDFICVWVKL